MSYDKLWARISQELEEILEAAAFTTEDSEELNFTTDPTQKRRLTNATATGIHSFYTGAERIFLEIAKQIDRSTPRASDWHIGRVG